MSRPSRHREPWTREDGGYLYQSWGKVPPAEIAAHLGRSLVAVRARAGRLGLPHHSYPVETLTELSERSGYARDTLVRAARAAGVELVVRPDNQIAYAIERADAKKILAEIHPVRCMRKPPKAWGLRGSPKSCVVCRSDKRPYYARGACRACYSRAQKRGRIEVDLLPC